MSVYYIVFFLSLLLSKVIPGRTPREYLKQLLWVFTPLFLFGALRVDFGQDYAGYEAEYNEVHGLGYIDNNIHSEIGYQLLEIIMPSWRSMLVLTSFATCISWVFILYKYVPRRYLSFALILFFITGNFTFFTPVVTMRNGLAIACMLLSAELIVKRKFIFAFVIAFLAHYIHSSILLFMPIAIIVGNNKALSKNEVNVWLGVVLILFMLGATRIMNYITGFLGLYFDRYEAVLEYMKESTHDSLLVIVANMILGGGLFYHMYVHRNKLDGADNSIFRIGVIYLLCPLLGSLGGTRMQCFFLPFFILTLVKMYAQPWQNSFFKISYYTLAISYFLYSFFYVWQWNNPYFSFQTYKSVLGG